jgi:dTMP kinase
VKIYEDQANRSSTSNSQVFGPVPISSTLAKACSDRTTSTGQMINGYLQGQTDQNDQAIHLLFSANRWEAVQSITRDLDSGCTIVVDRYSFSGAVYSAAKDNPSMSLEWCWNPEIGLLKPDLVLSLDISPEDAAKRGGFGEERYEKEEMQARVRTLFKSLFERIEQLNVKTINAGQPLKNVANDIRKAYEALQEQHPSPQTIQHLSSLT